MPAIFEVALGLIFVFTLVSLVCSVVVEWISGILALRGRNLWRGIDGMLGKLLAAEVCRHGLLQGLVRKSWFDSAIGWIPGLHRPKPSYVPARTFSTALLSVLSTDDGSIPAGGKELKKKVESWTPGAIGWGPREALLALITDAADDTAKTQKNIEDWYDATMDRASGWYKRWSQLTLFVVGMLIALWIGIDSLAIAKALWLNPDLRAAVAVAATTYVEKNPDAITIAPVPAAGAGTEVENADEGKDEGAGAGAAPVTAEQALMAYRELSAQMQALRLPRFPWGQPSVKPPQVASPKWWANLWVHLVGFLFTALAATLGAPFWFDLLSRLVKLRASGPPPNPKTDASPPAGEEGAGRGGGQATTP